jgi:hypothetical protein
MKICKGLLFLMLQISIVGIGNWSFFILLKRHHVRLDVKQSHTHCKGSQQITFDANLKIQASKIYNSDAKSLM